MNTPAERDAAAAEQLLPLLDDQFRRAAEQGWPSSAVTTRKRPTALVHEVDLSPVGPRENPRAGRGHFYAFAAPAMGRILIDHARSRALAAARTDHSWQSTEPSPA